MTTVKISKEPPEGFKTFVDKHRSKLTLDQEKLPASKVFYVSAYDDDTLIGALAAKAITVVKKSFLSIRTFAIDDADVGKQMLTELRGVVNETSSTGVLTIPFSQNDPANKALLASGYNVDDYLFMGDRSKLASLTVNSDITMVPFSSRNHSGLHQLFTKLLLEHDESTNHLRNRTYKTKLFKEHLQGSKSQNIRVSYFITGVLRSSNWSVFLLFLEDEPIGFIKGVTSRSNPCFPDIYLRDKYKRYADSAMGIFARNVPKSQQQLGKYVSAADTTILADCKKWFGEPIASTYFNMF